MRGFVSVFSCVRMFVPCFSLEKNKQLIERLPYCYVTSLEAKVTATADIPYVVSIFKKQKKIKSKTKTSEPSSLCSPFICHPLTGRKLDYPPRQVCLKTDRKQLVLVALVDSYPVCYSLVSLKR